MILLTVLLLALMEVSLSFDNAVINASVLRDMPAQWQKRFITWGMPIAVFGMRLVFPILIVAVAGAMTIPHVVEMAWHDPAQYGLQLSKSHINISAFGGAFLLMVFGSFLIDEEKEIHWFHWMESKLSVMNRDDAVVLLSSQLLGTFTLVTLALSWADGPRFAVSALTGCSLFVGLKWLLSKCGTEGDPVACVAKRQGLMRFIYLEVLDASCSFDGVIGAFAMSDNIFVIMVGLGIGAFAIRSLTLHLVHNGTIKEYIYLEHGAHYGIGALGAIMIIGTLVPISEIVTGLIGISFIGLALLSSIRHKTA